ncbi:hypothetical protein ACI68E_000836 [Malassezia pachydermatis]
MRLHTVVFHGEPRKKVVNELQRVQSRLQALAIDQCHDIRLFDPLRREDRTLFRHACLPGLQTRHGNSAPLEQLVRLGIVLLDKLGQHADPLRTVRVQVVKERGKDRQDPLAIGRPQRAFALQRPHQQGAQRFEAQRVHKPLA